MSDILRPEGIAYANELAAFGVSAVEARIYLHLLNMPPQSVLEIARTLDLPRTSIYDNALKLIEKGLVRRTVKFKSQKLQACPIEVLQTHIDEERLRVENLQETLGTLKESLPHTVRPSIATEVRYYHGVQGLQQIIWNNLRAQNGVTGYSQFGLAEIVGERFALKHASELARRHIVSTMLTNPASIPVYRRSKLVSVNNYRKAYQECRVLSPEKLHVSGDCMVYNDIFATIYWQQGEYVGVEIENSELAKTQRSMLAALWQQATPSEKYYP